jgi:hypothetical protein
MYGKSGRREVGRYSQYWGGVWGVSEGENVQKDDETCICMLVVVVINEVVHEMIGTGTAWRGECEGL